MRIFLIGIGGTSASYLVELAKANGDDVFGSDFAESLATEALKSKGIEVFISHSPDHIDESIDEVWYSAAITATSDGYQELMRAHELEIPCLTFAQASARFFNRANLRIAVAGTHGKSTTTAMVGWVLEKAGLNPTVALGAELKAWKGNGRIGDPEVFVIEADEYAKRFLEFVPTHAIITSIDHDHFDTYPKEDDYLAAFRQFIGNVEDGIVVNASDGNVNKVTSGYIGKLISYTKPDSRVKLKIPGYHNLMNASSVLKMAEMLEIDHGVALDALADFPGIVRRMEYIGEFGQGIKVYDDYGHHPVEIKATLNGLKSSFPGRDIVLVYQPHQAGRLRNLMDETADALNYASHVILLPVYQVKGREKAEDIKLATSEALAKMVSELGGKVELANDYESAAKLVKKTAKDDEIIITMGATDVWQVSKILCT